MSRFKIKYIIIVLLFVGILFYIYERICVFQPFDIVVNEYAFMNDSYLKMEEKLAEDGAYIQTTFSKCRILTLEHQTPLYIVRGNYNNIYNNKSTRIQVKEDADKIYLRVSPVKDKYDAVFMFISEFPDTVIITNKDYYQDLYLVNFSGNINTPVLIINDATAVVNSDISKLNVFVNNGIFSFYEYCLIDDDIDISELQLKVCMIDSRFFLETFLSDSIMVDIKSKKSWFDISVQCDYIKNFSITGDVRTQTKGEKNSVISFTSKRDTLMCDSLNIEIENDEYLDLVFSDSMIVKNGNILRSDLK